MLYKDPNYLNKSLLNSIDLILGSLPRTEIFDFFTDCRDNNLAEVVARWNPQVTLKAVAAHKTVYARAKSNIGSKEKRNAHTREI
jgi:hypothetical protein